MKLFGKSYLQSILDYINVGHLLRTELRELSIESKYPVLNRMQKFGFTYALIHTNFFQKI
jgi:hypothetical protein